MLVNEHLRTVKTSKKVDPVKTGLPFYYTSLIYYLVNKSPVNPLDFCKSCL